MMREIDVTEECLQFIDNQDERVSLKFFQLLEVFGEVKVVHTNFLKKLQGNFMKCGLRQVMNFG